MPLLRSFRWQPRGSVIKPHLFDATLAPHGLRVELVPTDHAAALRYETFCLFFLSYFSSAARVTFPSNTDRAEKRVCFREGSWTTKSELLGSTSIVGRATQVNMDRMHFNNFNLFIATKTLQSASVEQHNGAICYRYKSEETTVIVHIATSLLSPEQAKYNLESEMKDKSFDELKEETRLVWNR
jgi:putative alpha-1,2-mannosidase